MEINTDFLREMRAPKFFKLIILTIIACTWKFTYYAPNTIGCLDPKTLKRRKKDDIKPIGLGARDTLRLEMGYCLYGNDIDDSTSPLEAGLGWVTKFTKNFINSDQLKKQKDEGVKRKLVGLEMIDRGIPRHGYLLYNNDGEEIGKITSGSISPMTNKGIALGYVKTGFHNKETEVLVDIRNKKLKMKVVRPPFI